MKIEEYKEIKNENMWEFCANQNDIDLGFFSVQYLMGLFISIRNLTFGYYGLGLPIYDFPYVVTLKDIFTNLSLLLTQRDEKSFNLLKENIAKWYALEMVIDNNDIGDLVHILNRALGNSWDITSAVLNNDILLKKTMCYVINSILVLKEMNPKLYNDQRNILLAINPAGGNMDRITIPPVPRDYDWHLSVPVIKEELPEVVTPPPIPVSASVPPAALPIEVQPEPITQVTEESIQDKPLVSATDMQRAFPYKVMLKELGPNKIDVIKEIREAIPGIGLAEAKEMSERELPTVIREYENHTEANNFKLRLGYAGALAEVH